MKNSVFEVIVSDSGDEQLGTYIIKNFTIKLLV